MKTPCECQYCVRNRHSESVIAESGIDKLVKLVRELEGQLFEAEDALNYHKANQDGSWPTAREYAENILKRCDEREKANADK